MNLYTTNTQIHAIVVYCSELDLQPPMSKFLEEQLPELLNVTADEFRYLPLVVPGGPAYYNLAFMTDAIERLYDISNTTSIVLIMHAGCRFAPGEEGQEYLTSKLAMECLPGTWANVRTVLLEPGGDEFVVAEYVHPQDMDD